MTLKNIKVNRFFRKKKKSSFIFELVLSPPPRKNVYRRP